MRHVAYGLDLRCSFPLPGMRAAAAEGLPLLALELLPPAELARAWSGPDGPPAWTGRVGDGRSLTIERGIDGDLLFTYGDRARFRLDASRERLDCAPLRAGLDWQQALLGRVLPNVAIMRGYEALHASAVGSPEGVVAVAAPSGMGKTTLALELLRRGWPLFADDVLTLGEGPAPTRVHAHPGTPHMNVAASPPAPLAPGEIGRTLGILSGERWVAVEESARAAAPVRMICLLERHAGLPLAAHVLPPSPLPLAPYMLGLEDDAERERNRFARYADLMGDATLIRLTCGSGHRPAELACLIEQVLSEPTALTVGGVG
ncbi:MAG: hypothetical protein ACRDLF_00975 [Solirubrobacteraceae bacterium]